MRILHLLCGSMHFFRVTNTVQPKADTSYYFGFARPLDDRGDRRVIDYRERTLPRMDVQMDTSVFFRSTDRIATLHLGPAVCPDTNVRLPGRGKIIAGVLEACPQQKHRYRLRWWFRDGRALLNLRNILLRHKDPSPKTLYRQIESRDPLYVLARCVRGDIQVLDPDAKHKFKKKKYEAQRGYDLHGVDPGLFAAAASALASQPQIYAKFANTFGDAREADHSAYVRHILDDR